MRGFLRAPHLLLLSALAGVACQPEPTPWVWDLPLGFPEMRVPEDNPITVEKVELGRHLFFDRALSRNETQACGSCHDQGLAFTDGLAQSVGSTGELTPRGSMALANIGYASTLTWASHLVRELEDQAALPLFGEAPVELGWAGAEDELVARLADRPVYQDLFRAAWPEEEEPVTLAHTLQAIASFQRTLLSGRSPFDRFVYDKDEAALSASAQRGMQLFFTEKVECFHCHGGFNFTDSTRSATTPLDERPFHNNGLYNIGGTGAYPPGGEGLFSVTGDPADMGRFKAPSLRNIALTAPYMHDGSVATLSEVIDHYAAGGRDIVDGPYAGDGRLNPNKNAFVIGFSLSAQEKADLLAFLESLTDDAFISDPAHAPPGPPPR